LRPRDPIVHGGPSAGYGRAYVIFPAGRPTGRAPSKGLRDGAAVLLGVYGATPGYRMKTPSQGTAETLVLIAWILQLIFSFILVAFGSLLLLAGGSLFFVGAASIGGLVIAAILVFVPILMLYVGFAFSYRRVRDGELAAARGPTLLLGILGLFVGGIIVGILYLVAYIKIGDAETEARGYAGYGGYPAAPSYGLAPGYGGGYPSTPWTAGGPPAAVPPGGVVYQPAPVALPQTCPRCGRPATYIPQYGRAYCYSCAQYV
jgi:hypothetical protein